MNIPKKIKIAGHKVNVRIVDEIELDNGGCALGVACGAHNEIILARFAEGQVVKTSVEEETFLHEITHYISDNAGLRLKEHQVNAIAAGLYQVLKDNKLKFFED